MFDPEKFSLLAQHCNDFIFYKECGGCVYVSQINLWAFVLQCDGDNLQDMFNDLKKRGYQVIFSLSPINGFLKCAVPNETWVVDQRLTFDNYAYLQQLV